MNIKPAKTALLLLMAVNLVACGHTDLLSDIERHSDKWTKMQITAYEYTVTSECLGHESKESEGKSESIRVRVAGEAVDSWDVDLGPPVDDESDEYRYGETIDAMFAYLKEDIKESEIVSVVYDRKYGFPAVVEMELELFGEAITCNIYLTDFEAIGEIAT